MVYTITVKPAVPKDNPQTANIVLAEPNKVSKLLTYMFRVYLIMFTVDFGFIESKSFKIKCIFRSIATFHCTIFCGIHIFTIINSTNISSAIWNVIFITQYLFTACIMNFATTDMTLFKFLNTLLDLDAQLNFDGFRNLGIQIFVTLVLSFATSLFLICILCLYFSIHYTASWLIQILNIFPGFVSDTILILNFFIFYTVYRCLVRLTSILNKASTNIKSCHSIYKSIIDGTLKVKFAFDFVVSMYTSRYLIVFFSQPLLT